MNVNQACQLCGRQLKSGTTEHHLIPKTCHKNRWFKKRYTRDQMRQTVSACRDCHRAIHRLIPSEKELGRCYNTLDLLLNHPQLSRCIGWIARQR